MGREVDAAPIMGALDTISRSHFKRDSGTLANLRGMIGSGIITNVRDLAMSLIRIDRPDAALRILRDHISDIGDIDKRGKSGYTLLALASECRMGATAQHRPVYNSLIDFLVEKGASIERSQRLLMEKRGIKDEDLLKLSRGAAAHA